MLRLSLDEQTYPGSSGFSPESDRRFWAFGINQYRTFLATGCLTKDQLAPLLATLPAWARAELQAPSAPPPSAPLAAPPPASPPAQKPCASTPPELPPQPTSTPVPAATPARSYPPSPSVETIEEVELKQVYKIPLRNIRKRPTEQKHRASKTVSKTCVAEILENWITWPPRFCGIYMRFSRDEEPDAWYTTMLNATDALPYRI